FDSRVHVAPLREMTSEGASFGRLFELALGISRAKFRLSVPLGISESQLEKLKAYKWPGNLREMLEMADSLVAAIKKDPTINLEKKDCGIKIPEHVFQKVFSQFEYFAEKLSIN
ncbi:hypothetical protein MUP77_02420, partial [Candidatus Bathyarchaeota archaeon]|nr:hypothetical protein [Candidatus Bathyarchaeota archaeon]